MNLHERSLSSGIAKAIQDFSMIKSGDKVLIAVSGGKDSTLLLRDFSQRAAYSRIPFEIAAVHIKTEFGNPGTPTALRRFCGEWKVPYFEISIDVQDRLKPGRKMNCYWCSTQRRTELIRFALENGFTKIALGHHLDDIIETLFMNMMHKAEIATMLPVMPYRKYPLVIIRPLALIEEKTIIRLSEFLGLSAVTCSCDFGSKSYRKKVREKISVLTDDKVSVKRNIFYSMGNINKEYLP